MIKQTARDDFPGAANSVSQVIALIEVASTAFECSLSK
jgi:hypothetical protein